jgi:protease-4
MSMLDTLRAVGRRLLRSYVLFVVVGLVVGLLVAPVAMQAVSTTEPTIAVVPLEGTIDGGSAAAVSAQLQRARENPDVAAVVIVSNSGGGTASGSETLYLAAKRTAEAKPLVASVDASAASGAYYTIAPSDYIYAKPSSIVGSVGVRANLPVDVEPNDIIGATGPNKLNGYDQREFYYVLESLRRAFVGAVFESRGDRITVSRSEVATARIFSGAQAVEAGLADGIGDRQSAIREAAERAEVENYRVAVYRPDGTTSFLSRANYLASTSPEKEMVSPDRFTGQRNSAPVFLMVPGSYLAGGDSTVRAVEATGGTYPSPAPANATAAGADGSPPTATAPEELAPGTARAPAAQPAVAGVSHAAH